MRTEKTVLERYKEEYENFDSPKSFNLEEVRNILKKVRSTDSFPIVIDENEIKTANMIQGLFPLQAALIEFIEAWEKVYKKKPLIKNITQIAEGRLFEIELKLIYIEVFSIEKKYPEFSIGKLMGALEYPDFSEILRISESLNAKWFLIHNTVKGVFSLEDLYNNGAPKIDDKWVKKVESINQVTIKNEAERTELVVMFTFIEAFLQMLTFCEINRGRYDGLLEFMGKSDFVDLDRMKIQVSNLQRKLGLMTRISL